MFKTSFVFLIIFLTGWSVISDDLVLVVDKDRFELENSSVKIKSIPGQLRFTLSYKVASYSFDFAESRKVKLLKITVEQNTEDLKRIKLISDSFIRKGNNVRYHLSLEARRTSPFIFIEMGLENLTDEAICGYFFLKLCPMRSEYYVTENGEDKIRSRYIKTGGWVFLPVENKSDGIGLVYNAKRKNLKFGTNYPHKNWKSAGYYFMSNLTKHSPVPIKKNESNIIKLVVFPAKDEEEVEYKVDEIKKEEFAP